MCAISGTLNWSDSLNYYFYHNNLNDMDEITFNTSTSCLRSTHMSTLEGRIKLSFKIAALRLPHEI